MLRMSTLYTVIMLFPMTRILSHLLPNMAKT